MVIHNRFEWNRLHGAIAVEVLRNEALEVGLGGCPEPEATAAMATSRLKILPNSPSIDFFFLFEMENKL